MVKGIYLLNASFNQFYISVMTIGIEMMLKLCAECWDSMLTLQWPQKIHSMEIGETTSSWTR